MMTTSTAHPPLTILSDDEQMFRDAVAAFANPLTASRNICSSSENTVSGGCEVVVVIG